jgi:subtilase family serine protease
VPAAEAPHVQRAAVGLPDALRGPAGGYSPTAVATAYALHPAASRAAGLVVAIVDACHDSQVERDLAKFDAQYGRPAETSATFRRREVNGSNGCSSATTAGWRGETDLDIQAVRGICYLCHILLVQASSPSFSDLGTAVNYAARYVWTSNGKRLPVAAISNSYGTPDHNPNLPSDFATDYRHPGIAVIASNGDDGWYGWDLANVNQRTEGAPEVPAALGSVVAVGGTSLQLTSSGARSSETVWNRNGASDAIGARQGEAFGATGGGCSTVHAAPGWQSSVSNYSALDCSPGKRSATDIAALADPYTGYDVYITENALKSGWHTVGGTSLAAPLVAAMWALAGGPGGVRYPALSLYGHFQSHRSTLYDVAHGGNAFCGSAPIATCADDTYAAFRTRNPNLIVPAAVDCSFPWRGHPSTGPTQCRARAGYDGPSGVGTPNTDAAFMPLTPTAAISRPSTVAHGSAATFRSSSSSDPFPGGTIVQSRWYWGDDHVTKTSSSSATHTYAHAGTYTVSLAVTDNYGRMSSTRTTRVTVR